MPKPPPSSTPARPRATSIKSPRETRRSQGTRPSRRLRAERSGTSPPDLRSLRTVRQLCEEYPHLFSEGSLRWLIFRRKTNGFDRCVLHVGKRLYIDLEALRLWLAEHRSSRTDG